MIEGVMFICYLVIAEPDKPEACKEVPAPSKFATMDMCQTASEIAKRNFRIAAEGYGHKLTKLEATCEREEIEI